ncbi:MAG: hypothetical protein ACRDPD_34630, partial [Streptosporangiaceae bacterium]
MPDWRKPGSRGWHRDRPARLAPGARRQSNPPPVSALGWFTGHIRERIAVTRHQLELLQPARARPYLLDDDTVTRVIRVHHDQAADLDLFQNQVGRWRADPGPDRRPAGRGGRLRDADRPAPPGQRRGAGRRGRAIARP